MSEMAFAPGFLHDGTERVQKQHSIPTRKVWNRNPIRIEKIFQSRNLCLCVPGTNSHTQGTGAEMEKNMRFNEFRCTEMNMCCCRDTSLIHIVFISCAFGS